MKFIYLAGSIILTVIILILGFENVQGQCNFISIFLTDLAPSIAPTFLFFGFAALGILTGMFYSAFISTLLKQSSDEGDTDW